LWKHITILGNPTVIVFMDWPMVPWLLPVNEWLCTWYHGQCHCFHGWLERKMLDFGMWLWPGNWGVCFGCWLWNRNFNIPSVFWDGLLWLIFKLELAMVSWSLAVNQWVVTRIWWSVARMLWSVSMISWIVVVTIQVQLQSLSPKSKSKVQVQSASPSPKSNFKFWIPKSKVSILCFFSPWSLNSSRVVNCTQQLSQTLNYIMYWQTFIVVTEW